MIEKTFSTWSASFGDTRKWCGQFRLSTSKSSDSSAVSGFSGYPWCCNRFAVLKMISHDDSETSDLYLPLQILLCLWTVEHPVAILENSTLRRDGNFDLCLYQVSMTIQPVDLEAFSIGLFTDEELVRTEMTKPGFATILFSSFCSCILFAILSVQLIKLKLLAQQRELKWLMLNKMKKIVPFVTCEISFCQDVCNLVFGVNVPYWNLRIQVDSVKQPIKSNYVGSWHMSHCWTHTFEFHLNHGFIVLKHVQHSIGLRKFRIRKYIVNVKQIRTVVRDWSFGLILGALAWRGAMQEASLCLWSWSLQSIATGIGNSNFSTSSFHCTLEFVKRGFSIAHFCLSLRFGASEICFHISGHALSSLEVVCSLVNLSRTMYIHPVVSHSIQWILSNMSMHLTILFLHLLEDYLILILCLGCPEGGCSQVLFSSRNFDCSICDWEYENVTFHWH